MEDVGRRWRLKRRIIGVFKAAIALLLIVSSGLAIYSRSLGKDFDPVRECTGYLFVRQKRRKIG